MTIPNQDTPRKKTRNLIVLRAISGAGKSTMVQILTENNPNSVVCSADHYFQVNGKYEFDPTKLGLAHKACQICFDNAINDPMIDLIIIDNTNVKPSDYRYYVDKANEAGVKVIYVVLEKRHDNPNVHNVGEDILKRQEDNLRKDLKLR